MASNTLKLKGNLGLRIRVSKNGVIDPCYGAALTLPQARSLVESALGRGLTPKKRHALLTQANVLYREYQRLRSLATHAPPTVSATGHSIVVRPKRDDARICVGCRLVSLAEVKVLDRMLKKLGH